MRILITAGGTTEKIDEVRGISNHSTGRLGSLIADAFSQQQAEITYVCSPNALQPECQLQAMYQVETVAELVTCLTTLLQEKAFDVVIHSMAVSDYYLNSVQSESQVIHGLVASLTEPPYSEPQVLDALQTTFSSKMSRSKKISSAEPALYLQLKQTPKVIRLIKDLQPATCLVGFKLLVDTNPTELIKVAKKLMQKNQCDFVLANDLTKIHGDVHQGYLLNSAGEVSQFKDKQAIAAGIVSAVTERGIL